VITRKKTVTALNKNWLYLFIALTVLLNFSAVFIPITGPDGTLYALIAKNMVLRNDYVNLFVHGKDWLDKPHFPFWTTAVSFYLFGFTTWAYKLPAIMFVMIGARYTYLFAKNLYDERVGLWSVLILLSAEHIILSNNDVRAEPYLTGLIIAAIYHFYKTESKIDYLQLFAGCLFTACAIMTKGIFALIPIGAAIFGHMIITKNWKQLFNKKWVIAFFLVLVLIIPELACLYLQFDLHPEKLVFSLHHVSGIRFFFWDSQFGRFFNNGPIKGSGDPLFFVHTLLWAFLPWSLIVLPAIYRKVKKGWSSPINTEWYCLCCASVTFLVFSASQFQLPHYLTIIFPFLAIITADYLLNLHSNASIRIIQILQEILVWLLFVIICALHYYFKPAIFSIFTGITLLIAWLWVLFLPRVITGSAIERIGLKTLLIAFFVNLYLNLAFYPTLLHYQAASEAAVWLNTHSKKKVPIFEYKDDYISAFEFYSDGSVIAFNLPNMVTPVPSEFYLYIPDSYLPALRRRGWKITVLKKFERFWITRLNATFLNEKTRMKEITVTDILMVTQ